MSISHNEPPAAPARPASFASSYKSDNLLANKYVRKIPGADNGEPTTVDVYSVLEAFNVNCPGLQHAIKKMLCTGIRGQKDAMQDLLEARQALDRAIELQAYRDKQPKR